MYFEAMAYHKIKEVCHHTPRVVIRGRSIALKSRSWFHIFARILYKTLRAFYVSMIFYFVPFALIYFTYKFAKVKFDEYE